MAGIWCGEGVVEMGGTWRVPSQDSAEWRGVGAAGLSSHSLLLSLNVAPPGEEICRWPPHGLYRCIYGTACVTAHEWSISLALPPLNVSPWSRDSSFVSPLHQTQSRHPWVNAHVRSRGHRCPTGMSRVSTWPAACTGAYWGCAICSVCPHVSRLSAGRSACVWGRNPWGPLSLPNRFSNSTSLVKELVLLAGGRVY